MSLKYMSFDDLEVKMLLKYKCMSFDDFKVNTLLKICQLITIR